MNTSISVSVPLPMVDDITGRADELGYANRSEYVRELIREDIENDAETGIDLGDPGVQRQEGDD